jgi:hypothetical protein
MTLPAAAVTRGKLNLPAASLSINVMARLLDRRR